MSRDPFVKLLIAAYHRGKSILQEREQAQRAQETDPTKTKIASANGDFGKETDSGQHGNYTMSGK